MTLNYLLFDASDDGEGTGTWDAMAGVRAGQLSEVMKEVQTVLAWADAHCPGPRGQLDEGGVWDADQLAQTEGDWTTVTLTLTGPWTWGEELVATISSEEE